MCLDHEQSDMHMLGWYKVTFCFAIASALMLMVLSHVRTLFSFLSWCPLTWWRDTTYPHFPSRYPASEVGLHGLLWGPWDQWSLAFGVLIYNHQQGEMVAREYHVLKDGTRLTTGCKFLSVHYRKSYGSKSCLGWKEIQSIKFPTCYLNPCVCNRTHQLLWNCGLHGIV